MLVGGKNVFNELISRKNEIKKIYLVENFNDNEILNKIKSLRLSFEYKPKKLFYDFEVKNNQGIIMEIADYNYASYKEIIKKEEELILILDHIEDPHNLGAIIRTSEAVKVSGIIIPKDRSAKITPTVMKTSAGALNDVSICMVANINNTIKKLKNDGYWIVGTDLKGENYTDIDMKGKIAIVIGNEGKGISKLIKENCDFLANIPIKGKVESLNASVSAAVILYEALRQRK